MVVRNGCLAEHDVTATVSRSSDAKQNKHDSHVHKHARERLSTQQPTHHKHSADVSPFHSIK